MNRLEELGYHFKQTQHCRIYALNATTIKIFRRKAIIRIGADYITIDKKTLKAISSEFRESEV